jgi:hypothetical protein
MQLELKGETVAYCFFFFLFLCFFLVFLWEIGQWDRKWEGIKEKLSWRLRIWLRRGERERERVLARERKRQKNWRIKELKAKAWKEMVLTPKLIGNVSFTMNFIVDWSFTQFWMKLSNLSS